MPTPSEVTGLILAGGASRRFGRDKALAEHEGVPFVTRVHAALSAHTASVWVATGPTPRDYPVDARIALDPVPDGGPLAGLAAGLAACDTPWLLSAAVDLPLLTADALRPLLDAMPEAVDVAVAVDADGRRQPTVALWPVAAVQPVVAEQMTARRLALHALLDRLVVREVRMNGLSNVNDPDDLRAIGRR